MCDEHPEDHFDALAEADAVFDNLLELRELVRDGRALWLEQGDFEPAPTDDALRAS